MKKILLFLAVCLIARPTLAQDIFAYNDKDVNDVQAGIFASLSLNSTSPQLKRQDGYSFTAKGALGTVPMIGGYFQKGWGRFSVRGSLSFGYASYAFKYSQKFDSMTENFTPVVSTKFDDYTKVKHGSAFVMPQLDLGYLFGPFKKVYLIELRAGVGFHAYLSHAGDSIVKSEGGVPDIKGRFTYKYHTTEEAKYGQPDVWGSLVGTGYIGLRWQKTTSEFLNHFSMGIQACIPVYTQNVGYAQMEYKNESYVVITRERVDMSLFSFGLRFAYSFL